MERHGAPWSLVGVAAPKAGPAAGLRACTRMWRGIVLDTGFRAGCLVLAVAIEEPTAEERPPALVAAAEVL